MSKLVEKGFGTGQRVAECSKPCAPFGWPAAEGSPHRKGIRGRGVAGQRSDRQFLFGSASSRLVPTMTLNAIAEVLVYLGAIPLLVDCDPSDLRSLWRGRNYSGQGVTANAARTLH